MHDIPHLLFTFINPIILIMALVLVMSIVARSAQSYVPNEIILGIVFSAATVYSMSDPIILSSSGIFDMRGLLIGTSTALLGPKVGIMVLISGLSFRWGIGNPGMIAGFTSMLIAFSAGLIWRRYVRPRNLPLWLQSLTLGIIISTQTMAIFVAEPQFWAQLFISLGTYTLACNLLGSFLISVLINHELSYATSSQRLAVAALTDHLTGLLNRRSIEDVFARLSKSASWKTNVGMGTLYLDIDNFKPINDTHGHAAGDTVLKTVASRLTTTFRSQDVFSRIGGDEFVVLMPSVSEADAKIIAERCRRLIANAPVCHGDLRLPVSVSIGAIWTRNCPPLTRLLQMADQALYEAKSKGRNSVAFKTLPQFGAPAPLTSAA